MESSSWRRLTDAYLEKWREDLRHIDFWLNAYGKVVEYIGYSYNKNDDFGVFWILGAGPVFSFTRAISGIISEKISNIYGPYEHVIKVDLKPTPTAKEAQGKGITSIKYQLTLAVAKELGLLDQEYNRLKEMHDQLQYYTYGLKEMHDQLQYSEELTSHVRTQISPLVGKLLSSKKYMLVLNNLQWPIEPLSFTPDCGLPLLPWTSSRWLISPTSQDVYKESKSEDNGVFKSIHEEEHVVFLTIFALRQSAEHMLNTICQESIEYWHVIAINCFHYAMMIFANHSQVAAVTSDELIHQWATLLPRMNSTISSSSKCSDMRRVGRVILEAFEKYSLLQLPFSPANEAREDTYTGAQFFAYHGLIAESITIDKLTNNKKNWISFVGEHGCHVSREWLLSQEEETTGTTAFILKACSQQSPILSKLNHFLPKLLFLRVLDLSYTPLKSLPSSIGCLRNLRLLSLQGCHGLKTLSSSSTTSATDSIKNTGSPLSTLYQLEILDMNGVPLSCLIQDVGNQKSNLIYLNMSYSEITAFPLSFFQDMSNLEELILVNCSNLVELPPSMVALSSLTVLEITRTQIKYFPHKIFEEMQKLKSLKLIDNSNLISLTRLVSRVHEIKLEGHPNLKSFSLIGAPHIKRLSLRRCGKLEYVELKNLGALEELDLSSTSVKELPVEILNGTQLRRLLLLGVPSMLRFPWHMVQRLPEVFCFDQCPEGNGTHSGQVPQLCVSDPKFFYSFGKSCVDLVRNGRFFQSFSVQVTPCSTNYMRLQHEEETCDNKLQNFVQKQTTYTDIYNSCYAEETAIASPSTIPVRRTERHVQITGMQEAPYGLCDLLNVTKSISVTCDTSIGFFSYLSQYQDLEECELRWCDKMVELFYFNYDMQNLRNLHVSNLRSLVWFSSERHVSEFSLLEHLHLEYCPRLAAMVPDAVTLPRLKTLDILFCYMLKTIFCEGVHPAYRFLPNLERIRLQELPLLQHFKDNNATIGAPMWKELHVRGCWSLQHLPRLYDPQQTVKVNGERRWWSKLQQGSPMDCYSYEPKLPPKFASFDERTKVTSYLR